MLVSRTVLLEVEWVLRGAYALPPPAILNAFERLMSVPSVTLRTPQRLRAPSRGSRGMDFADALHVASSATFVAAFHTFDKAFARRAKKLGTLPVVHVA